MDDQAILDRVKDSKDILAALREYRPLKKQKVGEEEDELEDEVDYAK